MTKLPKLMDVKTPILFVGNATNYDVFLHQTGLKPLQVIRVVTLEKLRGYKDRSLFYGYGFSWIKHDQTIMQYCRDHNIKVYDISPLTLMHMRFI